MTITPVTISGDDFLSISNATKAEETKGTSTFDTIFNAAIDMYEEADSLQKAAEEAEISFALGYTDSTHDLAVAQQKANISLQYTVKVTNAVVSAYKELMNMQI